MVPCPWAEEAAHTCQDLDIGVHVTLTAEYPGYRWRSLTGAPSLHDAEGFLPATTAEVHAKADLDDVRAECRAQIERALAWGVDVSHLDSHMGTLQFDPRFYAIYLDLAVEYRLPLRMTGAGGERALGFDCRAARGRARRGVSGRALRAPSWPDPTRPLPAEGAASALRPGVTETWLHPVVDGPELRGYDLAAADTRAGDHATATDAALAALISELGVRLIGYRPLRDLQRGI